MYLSHPHCRTLLQQAKLTQKQRVSIEDQLAYEETVRLRVKKLEKELTAILFLLNVAINCRDVVLPHLPKLVDPVLNSVNSTLSKEYCVEMWESICKATLQDRKTGLTLVVHIVVLVHTYSIHAYIHTCIHTYIHIYIHVYIHTYMHTYIHTMYMHTYIHIYMYICMYVSSGLLLCWTTLKRISPLVKIPSYWSNLPPSSTMNLFASLPVTEGVNGDVLCSITLPLMRCIFRDQTDSGDNIGVALQTLSSFCKTHISVPEVIIMYVEI